MQLINTTKLVLSFTIIGLLMTGCGAASAPSPEDNDNVARDNFFDNYKSMVGDKKHKDQMVDANAKVKKDLANVFGDDVANAMAIVAKYPPDIKSLKKHISSDAEEVYFFNLLKDYIHNPSNIEIKTTETIINSSDEEKRQLKEMLNKKFGGKVGDAQLDQIVNQQLGSSEGTSKTIQQTALVKLPSAATSSIVSLESINMNTKEVGTLATAKDMIKVTYNFNDKSQAQNKLAFLTDKIKHFLSNDENWAIDDATSQNALKDKVFTSEKNSSLIKMLKQQIKDAKAKGEDTTYMEQGLAKYTDEAVNKNYAKSNNSAFVYSWYEDDDQGRHIVTIRLNTQENVLTVEFMKSMVMM